VSRLEASENKLYFTCWGSCIYVRLWTWLSALIGLMKISLELLSNVQYLTWLNSGLNLNSPRTNLFRAFHDHAVVADCALASCT